MKKQYASLDNRIQTESFSFGYAHELFYFAQKRHSLALHLITMQESEISLKAPGEKQ